MLRYQLEATILENKKEVVATTSYTDSFQVYTNRLLVSDSVVLKSSKDTLIKGIFSALLHAPESSTHNNMRVSFTASTPLDYWKLQMGNKHFTIAGRARFDSLLVGDFISNEMGNYSLQTSSSGAFNKQETKIIWSQYKKVEQAIKSNSSFELQKTIQQKINGRWNLIAENATLRVGDTLHVTVTIATPKKFDKILLEENLVGGSQLLLSQNIGEKKYASLFTKEMGYNPLAKQILSYQFILTRTGVFSTGNTVVTITSKNIKQKTALKSIQLFIPATEIRIEE
jgi:hypothetical protein